MPIGSCVLDPHPSQQASQPSGQPASHQPASQPASNQPSSSQPTCPPEVVFFYDPNLRPQVGDVPAESSPQVSPVTTSARLLLPIARQTRHGSSDSLSQIIREPSRDNADNDVSVSASCLDACTQLATQALALKAQRESTTMANAGALSQLETNILELIRSRSSDLDRVAALAPHVRPPEGHQLRWSICCWHRHRLIEFLSHTTPTLGLYVTVRYKTCSAFFKNQEFTVVQKRVSIA